MATVLTKCGPMVLLFCLITSANNLLWIKKPWPTAQYLWQPIGGGAVLMPVDRFSQPQVTVKNSGVHSQSFSWFHEHLVWLDYRGGWLCPYVENVNHQTLWRELLEKWVKLRKS